MFTLAAITGNAALDVLVGLFFLYFLLSIVCSAANEGIASALHLRAANLEQAIISLLGDKTHADAFYAHARIKALFKPGAKRKPSYIPSRAFVMTLLDMVVSKPDPKAVTPAPHLIEAVQAELDKEAGAIKNERVRQLLQDAIHEAGGDANRFRSAIERSFDEVMDRASGWYKRRVQLILLALAFALVVVINADSFGIGQRLWKDDALRAAVVAQANTTVQAGTAACASRGTAPDKAATCVDEVKALGIPLGWSHANSPHSITSGIGKAIGLLVTIFALSLGAPFWFDLLGKVANLRGSGPPAATAPTKTTPTQ